VIILAIYLAVTLGDPLVGVLAAIGLLLSIALHELGHSVVAMAFGCKVRDITLMLLGGCATMITMPRKAWQEFLMALAGPAVSLLLALIGLWIVPLIPGVPKLAAAVFMIFGYINLVLGVFNLAPAFPMDGGRILRSFLQQFFMTKLKATWIASRVGRFLAIAFGLWTLYSMFTGHTGGYLFIRLLLAFYIYRAAEREYQQVLMEEQGRGASNNPFAGVFRGFSFNTSSSQPPDDDGQVIISPPPYKRGSGDRVDIHKE
jgi:Zn-dependent protease